MQAGVHVDQPLQAYFRINSENMGQFERTLIIVDEGAFVHYVEGCSAPTYSTDSLHCAVVEIIVKKGAGVWLNNDVVLRLQVDDNPEPIQELRRLVEIAARQRERIRERRRR